MEQFICPCVCIEPIEILNCQNCWKRLLIHFSLLYIWDLVWQSTHYWTSSLLPWFIVYSHYSSWPCLCRYSTYLIKITERWCELYVHSCSILNYKSVSYWRSWFSLCTLAFSTDKNWPLGSSTMVFKVVLKTNQSIIKSVIYDEITLSYPSFIMI